MRLHVRDCVIVIIKSIANHCNTGNMFLMDLAVILLSGIDPLSIPSSNLTQSPGNYINTCTRTPN